MLVIFCTNILWYMNFSGENLEIKIQTGQDEMT